MMSLTSRKHAPRTSRQPIPEGKPDPSRAVEALRTLYELLEQYAPSWYTDEHHRQAASALGIEDKPCPKHDQY